MILPHTIDLLLPTVTTDRRGDRVESWTAPLEQTDVPAFVQPAASAEVFNADGTRLVTGMVAYCQAPDVTAQHRVRYAGRVYQVDGQPLVWSKPSGYHHTIVVLKAVG